MNDTEKIDFIKLAVKNLFDKSIELSPEDRLLELGLDSLDVVELQMYYEDELKTLIESDESPITVRDLMDLMK